MSNVLNGFGPRPCDCCDAPAVCPELLCTDGGPASVQFELSSNVPWTFAAGVAGTFGGQQSVESAGVNSELQGGITLSPTLTLPESCLFRYQGYTTAQNYTAYSWDGSAWQLWDGTGVISGIDFVYGAARFTLQRVADVATLTAEYWLAWLSGATYIEIGGHYNRTVAYTLGDGDPIDCCGGPWTIDNETFIPVTHESQRHASLSRVTPGDSVITPSCA